MGRYLQRGGQRRGNGSQLPGSSHQVGRVGAVLAAELADGAVGREKVGHLCVAAACRVCRWAWASLAASSSTSRGSGLPGAVPVGATGWRSAVSMARSSRARPGCCTTVQCAGGLRCSNWAAWDGARGSVRCSRAGSSCSMAPSGAAPEHGLLPGWQRPGWVQPGASGDRSWQWGGRPGGMQHKVGGRQAAAMVRACGRLQANPMQAASVARDGRVDRFLRAIRCACRPWAGRWSLAGPAWASARPVGAVNPGLTGCSSRAGQLIPRTCRFPCAARAYLCG